MKSWKSLSLLVAFFVFGGLATFGLENGVYAQDAGDAAGAAGAGMGCICMIFSFMIPLAIMGVCGFIVYKDATKNGVENGMLWAVVSFFTTWIGLLIYFLVIKKQHMEKQGK